MKELVKIGIAEDQVLFRKGFISLLEDQKNVEVVLEASNGKELLKTLKSSSIEQHPHIVFMDIQMPEMDGLQATEKLRKTYPHIRIIVLTMHNSNEYIIQMHSRGAHGFLSKDSPFEEVLDAIDMVMNKNKYYNHQAMQMLLTTADRVIRTNNASANLRDLSHRELGVLRLICDELSNQEIAEKLNVSVRTIEWHRRNIFTKLQVKTVSGLMKYAMENDLI